MMFSENDPAWTPVLNEVFSSLVPLCPKWSESVLDSENIMDVWHLYDQYCCSRIQCGKIH